MERLVLILFIISIRIAFSAEIRGRHIESLFPPLGGLTEKSPQLVGLDVKCARTGMSVHLDFDRPFHGVVFSKGHFYDPHCQYISANNNGKAKYSFSIPSNDCGSFQSPGGSLGDDLQMENTIIIQNDLFIQEVWDSAQRLNCIWQETFEKKVKSRPFRVYDPDKISVDVDTRPVTARMEIQQSVNAPIAASSGSLYVGDQTSVVIFVTEPTGKLDANVVSCNASSPTGEVMKVVDSQGCILHPDVMTQFTKQRAPHFHDADLIFHSTLKAFQVGDNSNFRMACDLEVCKGKCPKPCYFSASVRRHKRNISPMNALSPYLLHLQDGLVVLKKETVKDVHKSSVCTIQPYIAITVGGMLLVIACLSLLIFFLARKLRTTADKLNTDS